MNQIQQKQYTGKGGIYQQLTLPISENILIDEHEPVYVATAQLEELDYRKRYQAYSSKGRKSAAEPRIMVKLLVYGYMCGIYSTQKLELACCKNIDFISRGSLLQPQNALHEGPERVDELFIRKLCLMFQFPDTEMMEKFSKKLQIVQEKFLVVRFVRWYHYNGLCG